METPGIEPGRYSGRSRIVEIPLRNRRGEVVARAIIDAADSHLAELRWYLETGSAERSRKPYVRRRVHGVGAFHLHRDVLALGKDDPRKVDHINGNTLDCRRANLRIATTAQNAQNQGSRGGSSRHRGVTWDRSRRKWMASAMLNGHRTTIGRFDSEEEAALAAAAWRAENMPYSREAA